MWQMLKEMRSPEMRKSMGFAMTLVKNISTNKQSN
jgi:uncharacterized protein YjgD (DUF1641 family)